MPRDKDLKRIIRARMEKTGEAYTAARAHIVGKSKDRATTTPTNEPTTPAIEPTTPATSPASPARATPPRDLAAIAGMSDDKVREKTGQDWAGWTQALDDASAAGLEHGAIAKLVHERFGVGNWWAQTVTVGYERIKGLREPGQQRSGTYEINKSRTVGVPVERLFDACADDATRRRWLTDAQPVVSTATRPRTMRLRWGDGTLVGLYFTDKGAAKSSVAVQHAKLPDRATADRLKTYWGERLDALATLLNE